jgi:hypothetical protein
MPTTPHAELKKIKTIRSLIPYLRDEMGWPIETDDLEELTFEYTPHELGIDLANAAKIKTIQRLRPLTNDQPWGIFFITFEPKRLPVVALRRILGQVAVKKRASANKSERAAWSMDDLLFISNYGEGDDREISFAHFSQPEGKSDLPTLKVLGWDSLDTPLHLDSVATSLRVDLAWPSSDVEVDVWRHQWNAAFTLKHREVITTSRDLSIRLAQLARSIRVRILSILELENDKGPMSQLMASFKQALVHDLDDDGFADMYAQTIAYGLLSARIAAPGTGTADDLPLSMPVTNPFLKELMETFLHVGGRKGKAGGPGIDFDELGVSEVVDLLDRANMEAVIRDFGDRNPEEDPVIHFYELFLKEYDAKKRMQRGVFYTPRPVVSYIVRSVDESLRNEFGLADGLADTSTWRTVKKNNPGAKIPEGVDPDHPFVQILDPATGTGTFLVEIINVVHRTMIKKWEEQKKSKREILELWNEYVPNHLLPRLHGFELMMAPYAIAHMKIGLKLLETGYQFDSDERVRVFLTNSLEPAQDSNSHLALQMPALAHEATAVNAVKLNQRFTTVVGNPPYSAASHNPSYSETGQPTFIGELIQTYYQIDGKRLKERNPRWLQDDYVKFIRLAQFTVEKAGIGAIGMITNHGYLTNPTFRAMRHSLLDSFSVVEILDLNGNARRGGEKHGKPADENVFDIQQGVAIALLARTPSTTAMITHRSLKGARHFKFNALGSEGDLPPSVVIHPSPPHYLFRTEDAPTAAEYKGAMSIQDIFGISSVGIATARDALTIHGSRQSAKETARRFAKMDIEEARAEFALGKDSQDWRVEWAQQDLKSAGVDDLPVVPISYRPFDDRYTIYTGVSRGFLCRPRWDTMHHMLGKQNLGLVTARSNKSLTMDHFFVTRNIAEVKLGEATTGSCLFPLWLQDDESIIPGMAEGTRSNLSQEFLKQLSMRVGSPSAAESSTFEEDAFAYIYALLHSPTYRTRYATYLGIDYPRIFLPGGPRVFHDLTRIGTQLIALHLLEGVVHDAGPCRYIGPRTPEVQRVNWVAGSVVISAATSNGTPADAVWFEGVSEDVWRFSIGGRQVCEKWLKDRKGSKLSVADIKHYESIVASASLTLPLMDAVDEVIAGYGGWPGAFRSQGHK